MKRTRKRRSKAKKRTKKRKIHNWKENLIELKRKKKTKIEKKFKKILKEKSKKEIMVNTNTMNDYDISIIIHDLYST